METNSVFGVKTLSAVLNSVRIDVEALVGVSKSAPDLANRIYEVSTDSDYPLNWASFAYEALNGRSDDLNDLAENLDIPKYKDLVFSDCDSEEPSTRAYAVLFADGTLSFIDASTENGMSDLKEALNDYQKGFGLVLDIAAISLEDNLF